MYRIVFVLLSLSVERHKDFLGIFTKVGVVQGCLRNCLLGEACVIRDVVVGSVFDEPLDLVQIGIKRVAFRGQATEHGIVERRETVDERPLIDCGDELLLWDDRDKAF